MSVTRQSSEALSKRLASAPQALIDALRPALIRSADEVAGKARQLAEVSVDTGGTRDSITATPPGSTTPPYAQGGATVTTHDLQAVVTAGDPDNRVAHLVEFGTDDRHHKDGKSVGAMPPTPFMLPAWRLSRKRVEGRLKRAVRAAVKAVQGQKGAGDADA